MLCFFSALCLLFLSTCCRVVAVSLPCLTCLLLVLSAYFLRSFFDLFSSFFRVLFEIDCLLCVCYNWEWMFAIKGVGVWMVVCGCFACGLKSKGNRDKNPTKMKI